MVAKVRNCYVGMFDILGFKALRANRGTAGVVQLYDRSLLAMIQHAAARSSKVERVGDRDILVPQFTSNSVAYRVISDTVIFFARDDSFDSFFAIVDASCNLLKYGLMNGQTPFRGAIGHGDLYDEAEVTVGSAIEDAYLGELSQLWAGAMFTPNATAHAEGAGHFDMWMHVHDEAARIHHGTREATNAQLNGRRITRYDVPHKPDGATRNAPVLDWTINMFPGAIEKALPLSDDKRATCIRENTLMFEEWARSRS